MCVLAFGDYSYVLTAYLSIQPKRMHFFQAIVNKLVTISQRVLAANVRSHQINGTGAGDDLLQGYKAQSEMVIDSLETLIRNCAARHESLVCEGVHLSLNFVVQLMQRNPTVVPFLVYISNEDKHKERFAVSSQLPFLLGNKFNISDVVTSMENIDLSG